MEWRERVQPRLTWDALANQYPRNTIGVCWRKLTAALLVNSKRMKIVLWEYFVSSISGHHLCREDEIQQRINRRSVRANVCNQSGELYRSFENGETWHEIGETLSLIGNTLYSSSALLPGQSVPHKRAELEYEMLVYRCYYNYERFWRSRNQRSCRFVFLFLLLFLVQWLAFLEDANSFVLDAPATRRWNAARSFLHSPTKILSGVTSFRPVKRVSPWFSRREYRRVTCFVNEITSITVFNNPRDGWRALIIVSFLTNRRDVSARNLAIRVRGAAEKKFKGKRGKR